MRVISNLTETELVMENMKSSNNICNSCFWTILKMAAIIAVSIGVFIFLIISLPALLSPNPFAEGNGISCISNMEVIQYTKNKWATESGAKQGQTVEKEVIDALMLEKRICPEGGVYEYGVIGGDVECSIHGSLKEFLSKENDHNGIKPVGSTRQKVVESGQE